MKSIKLTKKDIKQIAESCVKNILKEDFFQNNMNNQYDNDEEDTYLKSISSYSDSNKVVKKLSNNEKNKRKSVKFIVSGGPGKIDAQGENDYSTSSLQKILNNYYYISKNYSGNSSYTFTNIGIKNDVTRNIISSNN